MEVRHVAEVINEGEVCNAKISRGAKQRYFFCDFLLWGENLKLGID